MTTKSTTIELPRLENESARAYAARVEYVTMGTARSLETIGQKLGKSTALMERWSSKYGWVSSAAKYDAEVFYLTVAEASDKYRADLEDHRKRASEAGKALYSVAGKLLQRMNTQAATIELNGNMLSVIKGALQTALDLEAHALGVDQMIGRLSDGDE